MDFFKYAISKKFYISSDNCADIIRKLIHSDNEDNKSDKNCDLETVEYLRKIGFDIKIKDLKKLLFIINNNLNRIKCLADNGII
ncbi:hypothetical protein [Brachyspira innocens]|uniref:hypothetical protein n=1 Tax=Brachyspira innocens TaxID=13264 RepID=UPI0026EF349D|nr:hypothetical protein [Brachyspira innocens]